MFSLGVKPLKIVPYALGVEAGTRSALTLM
jgi:hypothetical protein